MPVIPKVFNSIRPGDVLSTPVKTYKLYRITADQFYGSNNAQIHPDSASGYRVHGATWKYRPPNIYDDYPFANISAYTAASSSIGTISGYRDTNLSSWPFNPDGTNTHVVWKSIDHRYYRFPYDPSQCHELTTFKTEKNYFAAASVVTIPYFDMGERIKPGTVSVTNTGGGVDNNPIELIDDGNGNLRDSSIVTSSFASSSACFFYMSFNNEFRQFETGQGFLRENKSVEYKLVDTVYRAEVSNIRIMSGVDCTSAPAAAMSYTSSGLSAGFRFSSPAANTQTSGIRIPHDPLFNKFNPCDRWTISFWVKFGDLTKNNIVMSKRSLRQEFRRDKKTQIFAPQFLSYSMPGPTNIISRFNNYKMPWHIYTYNGSLYVVFSNGTTAVGLSTNAITQGQWHHIAITRTNTNTNLYIDGTLRATSAVSLSENTQNDAWLEFGCCGGFTNNTNGYETKDMQLSEIRFYEYAVPVTSIATLAYRDWYYGQLYQTNTAGNVFYRNGQIVVSSPMPKYNGNRYIDDMRGYQMYTGSNDLGGFFRRMNSGIGTNPSWQISYRGVHTIYENEVMVRIPSDQFNYTYNPTATYRPGTDPENNNCNTNVAGAQTKNEPGELYLDMFISGTAVPYITTIGLYNDNAQLLAIGKLAMPILKTPDVDMNIIVRWDY